MIFPELSVTELIPTPCYCGVSFMCHVYIIIKMILSYFDENQQNGTVLCQPTLFAEQTFGRTDPKKSLAQTILQPFRTNCLAQTIL